MLQRHELTQTTKTIGYGDFFAHAFLWQRAITMVPLWAIAAVPVVGLVCRSFGNAGMQLGFGLVLCYFVTYFLEDLLKRRIRMDDENVFFGFKSIPIKEILSVDIAYKKGKFLPAALILHCKSGRKIKLNLSGLSEDGVDTLLKHLEVRNSNLKTAAVLNTLVKCRQVKRKTLEQGDQLELQYHSRQFIHETVEAFRASARRWIRVGPVAVCVISGPIWMSWLSSLYLCLQPHSMGQYSNLNLNKFLTQCFDTLLRHLGTNAGRASEVVQSFANNPFVSLLTTASIGLFVIYLLRLVWQPNLLIANTRGIKLAFRVGDVTVPIANIDWAQIKDIQFQQTKTGNGILRLSTNTGRKFDITLSCIAPEDRVLLLRHLEKSVQSNQIDHQLSQAMLPKSDRSYTEIWLQSLNQPPERKTLEPLGPGQLIGESRFEVLKNIGVGGQGKAYLCKLLEPGNIEGDFALDAVVLKETLIPIFADNSVRRKALEGFEKEASLLKSLRHDGVVKLIDYFVEDHRAYLVLEHVDGCNLRELVQREGRLPEDRVRDLAIQMCDILKFLHANSVVHRDFTPDNLILNSKGKLKLIDFNVAQQIKEGSSGTIVGKHAYLPPEQFRGKATSQSDLYALGATLYYLLTGEDPEPITQSSPAKTVNHLSEQLDSIVKRATALQTNNRYSSADEIENDLLGIDSKEETVTPSVEQEKAVTLPVEKEKTEVAQHG